MVTMSDVCSFEAEMLCRDSKNAAAPGTGRNDAEDPLNSASATQTIDAEAFVEPPSATAM
jgi:hypothetical protein